MICRVITLLTLIFLPLSLITCQVSKHKPTGVPAPVADFTGTPTSGSAPLAVTFTDLSTGQITSREWDFDNNGTVDSTERNPTHTYTVAGAYSVKSTVTGPCGSHQEVKRNYITVLVSATLFVKTWGGGGEDGLFAIAVDSSGNIYCAGYTKSFGAGDYDALLLKYDSSGALQWAKTWGGTNDDHLHAVALDSGGNIYCGGCTHSFGAGEYDGLLLKYDSSGALQWAKTWGGSQRDTVRALAIDSPGNIYCTGYTTSFGVGRYDTLLLKYDSSGALQWTKTWGGSDYEELYAVAVDSGANVYCAGCTDSFGAGDYDALLLKYDSSGALVWVNTWGGRSEDRLHAVAVDSRGNVYCAGYARSFQAGGYDTLLLKYDSSGALKWAKTWTHSYWGLLHAVALDSSGNIYCAGSGGLLLKYNSSGALQWTRAWRGSKLDYLYVATVDSVGNVYLGGWTKSYTGIWQEVTTGTEGTPSGTVTLPTGTEGTPAGTEVSFAGTETSPEGSETGAGGEDILLLKNW